MREDADEDPLSLFQREQEHAGVPAAIPWRVEASAPRHGVSDASPESYPPTLHARADLVARLDRRLIDAVNALETHLENFAAQKDRIDAACLELEDRVANARSGLDRVLGNASDARSALHDALAELPDHHRRLAHTEQILGGFEQRALEARTNLEQMEERALQVAATLEQRVTTLDQQRVSIDEAARLLHERALSDASDLDRRLLTFEAQRGAIESAIATAEQVKSDLAQLDRRVVDLTTGESSGLARANAHVSHLEEMAAAATADLKRLARARDELKHELAHLQVDVKKVTKAAESDARKVEHVRKQTAHLRSELSGLSRHTSTLTASLPRRTNRIERLRRLFSRGVLLFVALFAVSMISTLGLRTVRGDETPTRIDKLSPVLLSARTLPAVPLLTLVTTTPPPFVRESRPTAIVPERRLPIPAMPVQSAEPAPAAQPLVGSLSIDSEPSGATVFVNQHAVGETPLMLDSLRIGSYVIRLELTSYQPWTAGVQVSAVQQTRVSASLKK